MWHRPEKETSLTAPKGRSVGGRFDAHFPSFILPSIQLSAELANSFSFIGFASAVSPPPPGYIHTLGSGQVVSITGPKGIVSLLCCVVVVFTASIRVLCCLCRCCFTEAVWHHLALPSDLNVPRPAWASSSSRLVPVSVSMV